MFIYVQYMMLLGPKAELVLKSSVMLFYVNQILRLPESAHILCICAYVCDAR